MEDDAMKDKTMMEELMLSDIMHRDEASCIERVAPAKPRNIQDWLREDHRRNELVRDVEALKRDVDKVQLFLSTGVVMLALVLIMQLLLWSTR